MVASDYVVVPVAPDLFSIQGLRNLGPALRTWRKGWENRRAQLKHYQSLMPLSQEARKPIFHLKPADGAFGGHAQAAQAAHQDFKSLASAILDRVTSAGRP